MKSYKTGIKSSTSRKSIFAFTTFRTFSTFSTFQSAFSLIELLVVISIIGILTGLSIFGLQGARASSRDAKRKADIEQIRSGLEMYRSDCLVYPTKTTAGALTSPLVGDGSSTNCAITNTYVAQVPTDPQPTLRDYNYYSLDGISYEICASLEQGSSDSVICGSSSTCGPCENSGDCVCNYKTVSP
jgi:prepilin-type N-terminal cleavage/methylation domain-containing protein